LENFSRKLKNFCMNRGLVLGQGGRLSKKKEEDNFWRRFIALIRLQTQWWSRKASKKPPPFFLADQVLCILENPLFLSLFQSFMLPFFFFFVIVRLSFSLMANDVKDKRDFQSTFKWLEKHKSRTQFLTTCHQLQTVSILHSSIQGRRPKVQFYFQVPLKTSTTKVFSPSSTFLSGLFHPLILKRLSWRSKKKPRLWGQEQVHHFDLWLLSGKIPVLPFFQQKVVQSSIKPLPLPSFFCAEISGLFFHFSTWHLLNEFPWRSKPIFCESLPR